MQNCRKVQKSRSKANAVICHSRKRSESGILLKKDSGQAGMTEKGTL
jgi:hypothetical protein